MKAKFKSAAAIFPKRLRELRTAAEMSQPAFALAVGIGERSVRLYESGEIPPTLETLDSMAKVLGVQPADLIS